MLDITTFTRYAGTFLEIGGGGVLLGLFAMRAFSSVRRKQPAYWLAMPGLLAVIVVASLCGWFSNNWTSPLVGISVSVVLFVAGADAQAWWMGTRLWEGALALLAAEARILSVMLAVSLPFMSAYAMGLYVFALIVIPGTTIPLFALIRKAIVCWRNNRGRRILLAHR